MIELKIHNLSFSYGKKKPIFCNFNLTVNNGITLILGANGAGKSTLFKLLCDVLIPQKGTIELSVNGKAVPETQMKRYLAYIPQNFDVFPTLTVNETLTYICNTRNSTLSKNDVKSQVEYALKLADIEKYAQYKMKSLSGGTKQRVGIAQSILGSPKVIVADEPTAGLDPEQRERYHQLVHETAKDRCFIISTHLFEDTEYYNNLVLICDGAMTFQGTKDEFVNSVKCSNGKSGTFKEAWIYYANDKSNKND